MKITEFIAGEKRTELLLKSLENIKIKIKHDERYRDKELEVIKFVSLTNNDFYCIIEIIRKKIFGITFRYERKRIFAVSDRRISSKNQTVDCYIHIKDSNVTNIIKNEIKNDKYYFSELKEVCLVFV